MATKVYSCVIGLWLVIRLFCFVMQVCLTKQLIGYIEFKSNSFT